MNTARCIGQYGSANADVSLAADGLVMRDGAVADVRHASEIAGDTAAETGSNRHQRPFVRRIPGPVRGRDGRPREACRRRPGGTVAESRWCGGKLLPADGLSELPAIHSRHDGGQPRFGRDRVVAFGGRDFDGQTIGAGWRQGIAAERCRHGRQPQLDEPRISAFDKLHSRPNQTSLTSYMSSNLWRP